VPGDVGSGFAARVELDFLGVAAGHVCVLGAGRAYALLLGVLLLLLDELAFLLALGHVGGEGVAVDVVARSLDEGVEHAVLFGQVWVLHALAHDGVHQPGQLAVWTYYLRRCLERIALEEDTSIVVLCCRCLSDGYRRGACRVLLLRLRLEVCQGDGLGLRGGRLHAEQLLGSVA